MIFKIIKTELSNTVHAYHCSVWLFWNLFKIVRPVYPGYWQRKRERWDKWFDVPKRVGKILLVTTLFQNSLAATKKHHSLLSSIASLISSALVWSLWSTPISKHFYEGVVVSVVGEIPWSSISSIIFKTKINLELLGSSTIAP